MNFGQLRAAIRNHKGTVYLRCTVLDGVGAIEMDVPIQKTPFIREVMPKAFGSDAQSHPTGLVFDNGLVRPSGDDPAPDADAAPVADLDLDLTGDGDLDLTAEDDPLDLDLTL